MRRFASFVIFALSFCVVALLLGAGGCAYLNGDAMWLGEAQKSVSVSNTLMTFRDTTYDFEAGNLPFEFACEPSKCPYLFVFVLQTNSIFKVRFPECVDPKNDEYVEIRNGVARVHKRDKSGWILSSKDVGTEISRCDGVDFSISGRTGQWGFTAYAANEGGPIGRNYYVEGKFVPCKALITRRFVIEECQNVIFRHIPNWYDWGCY